VLSCLRLRLLKDTLRRHSTEKQACGPRHTPEKRVKTNLSGRATLDMPVCSTLHTLLSLRSTSFTCRCNHTPTGFCGRRREHKRSHVRTRTNKSPCSLERFDSSCPCLHTPSLQPAIFSPIASGNVYNGHTDNERLLSTLLLKGTMPMSEPTQELIVSELRRRVQVSIVELMQVLGLQFASILPQEIQRMKASGLVMYEEPLRLYSVISLPR
jgi:hypothetical protein